MNNPLKHTFCVCKYTYKYISAGWCDDDNDYDDVGDDDDGGGGDDDDGDVGTCCICISRRAKVMGV